MPCASAAAGSSPTARRCRPGRVRSIQYQATRHQQVADVDQHALVGEEDRADDRDARQRAGRSAAAAAPTSPALDRPSPRTRARPVPRNVSARPDTTWSARRWIVMTPWSMLSSPPASIAATTPSHGLPVDSATENAATAPISIIPSTPRLSTPDRSAKISPIAANSRIVPLATPRGQDRRRGPSGDRQPTARSGPGSGSARRWRSAQNRTMPWIIAGTPDGWISRPARISAPNRIDATTTRERLEPGQVGDDDRGEAVAGRDPVLEAVDRRR